MKLSRLTFVPLLAALAFVAAACGGSGDVPAGTVAVVNGTEVSRAELDEFVERAKKNYEGQDQEFPKVGTPEYQNVQRQYVAFLVQTVAFEQQAEELDVEITEEDVDKELDAFVKSRFDGKQKEYLKELEAQGWTEEAFRKTIRFSVLSQKLYDVVTKDVEVADADVTAYYQQNASQYSKPESRDVRHILIAEKGDGDKVDFASSKVEADRIYAELQGGGDFAALAKEFSQDPGSKDTGGKLTITRGQTVPEFDKTSFDLKQGVVSQPVKTTYGYHIIEALSPVRKAETTPIAKVKASIEATLLTEQRSAFMTTWVEDLLDEYESKVRYALGFEPPELPDTTETETTETE